MKLHYVDRAHRTIRGGRIGVDAVAETYVDSEISSWLTYLGLIWDVRTHVPLLLQTNVTPCRGKLPG